jgi:hypothetical protein
MLIALKKMENESDIMGIRSEGRDQSERERP